MSSKRIGAFKKGQNGFRKMICLSTSQKKDLAVKKKRG